MRDPEGAWSRIAAERPAPLEVLLGYAIPWSLLPAAAWALGLVLFPHDIGGAAAARDATGALVAGAWTFAGSLLTVGLLAAAITAVAPMYGIRRSFPASLRVAAFGMTPLWLAGALLIKPALVLVLVVAALHALVLVHSGLRLVLNVKPGEAAEYAAVSAFLTLVASSLVGGLLSFFQVF